MVKTFYNSEEPKRRFSSRSKRLLLYLVIILAICGYYYFKTDWSPGITLKTEHYTIKSNSSRETTELTGKILERQYIAYSRIFEKKREADTFLVHLYKDRKEFKRVNPLSGWAEAFYLYPACHFYVNPRRPNPYHWGVHEGVHQLNWQYAGLKIPIWANEGIALLFCTSIIDEDCNLTNESDMNTYPMWWVDSFSLSDDISKDIRNRQFIAIKDIVYSKHPIEKDIYFNLYYVMWWALTYYLYWEEDGAYRDDYMAFIYGKTSLDDFYNNVIEANGIEKKVHAKLKKMQTGLIPVTVISNK